MGKFWRKGAIGDYVVVARRTVGPRTSLLIELAPGGGYVARLTR